MKVLKAIGGIFVKIWRWIKETAWVQPLLIVGAIFAIIFSIPYFTKWIGEFGWGSSNAYYSGFQVSLEGEVAGYTDRSNADKLTKTVWDGSHFNDVDTKYDNAYGDKFYLVYVSKSCTNCEAVQPGFDTLQKGWGSTYSITDDRSFKMYTVFTDETSSTDDADVNKYTAFQRYLDNFDEFFSEAGGRLGDSTPYRYNAGLESSTDYTAFQDASHADFVTPTIVLVDYSPEAVELGRQGASEVLFGVTGADRYAKAKLLQEMWNHTDPDNNNPFSKSFVKNK